MKNFLILLLLASFTCIEAQTSIQLPQKGLCAHRGAMDTHPENTLPAFKEAIRLGAQMIEFDVQLSKDGKLVIMHDDSIDRTTNGSGLIAEMNYSDIRKLDAGIKKSEAFKGTKVPSFEETLALMPKNIWLNCHLKGHAKLGEMCAKVLKSTGRLHQAFLTCNEEAADAAVKAVPQVLICNADNKYRNQTETYAKATIARKAQFIQLLRPAKNEDQKEILQLLKQNGVKVNFFYAKSPEELASLFTSGVDFVLVNNLSEMMPAALATGIKPVIKSK
ncbi:glycerophosphodiester phosphodiesterase [Desertivirga arenae]|uniref:glycerophosphodiester phosphodiesterase n=1 Tax=Desertivirga arenae TaxID=2810309 RepID=UPI001A9792A2|nr:glycerophosphodiester phosphodiesterase family protein [Pedobacter sp. SYSU D00823]